MRRIGYVTATHMSTQMVDADKVRDISIRIAQRGDVIAAWTRDAIDQHRRFFIGDPRKWEEACQRLNQLSR